MTVALFASLIWQVIDWLREVTNLKANRSSVVTQLLAWIAGIALIAVAAHAAVTETLVLPGLAQPLGDLDAGSTVLVGLLAASLASSAVDVKQAIDTSDSSKKPPLIAP